MQACPEGSVDFTCELCSLRWRVCCFIWEWLMSVSHPYWFQLFMVIISQRSLPLSFLFLVNWEVFPYCLSDLLGGVFVYIYLFFFFPKPSYSIQVFLLGERLARFYKAIYEGSLLWHSLQINTFIAESILSTVKCHFWNIDSRVSLLCWRRTVVFLDV